MRAVDVKSAVRRAWKDARGLSHTWGSMSWKTVESTVKGCRSLGAATSRLNAYVCSGTAVDEYDRPITAGACGWGICAPVVSATDNRCYEHQTGTGRLVLRHYIGCTECEVRRPGNTLVAASSDCNDDGCVAYAITTDVRRRHLYALGLRPRRRVNIVLSSSSYPGDRTLERLFDVGEPITVRRAFEIARWNEGRDVEELEAKLDWVRKIAQAP